MEAVVDFVDVFNLSSTPDVVGASEGEEDEMDDGS